MRPALTLFALCVTIASVLSSPAPAQTPGASWLQIEAQPSRAEAEDRARAWQALFPDVMGFQSPSGWFILSLGPYTPEQAEARRQALRAENMIPRDSFVSDGADYGAPFWPPGANSPPALTAPAPADPTAPAGQAATAPDTQDAALAALPDETPEQALASEAALPQSEREDIQRALMWFGFYAAAVDGNFGRGTRASMAAWQAAGGLDATGILTSAQRQSLLAAYRKAEAALGLQTVTEAEAGIEATLPLGLVAFDRYDPPFVHFTARDGSDTGVILISQPGDQAALTALYDRLQGLAIMPASGPRGLSSDSFTLRGEAPDRVTEAFATARRGMVKGWVVTWNPQQDPALAADMDFALQALKSSFRPIGDRALDPGLVPLAEATRSGLLAGLDAPRPRLSRSGFYVDAQGRVATTLQAVDQCARITLDRDVPARLSATDPASGVALLTPSVPLSPRLSARFADPAAGTEVAVAGYSYGDTLPAPVLTFGTLAARQGLDGAPDRDRLALAAQPGDAGGPILTAAGAVAGMLLPRPDPATSAPMLPPGVELASPAHSLARMLQAAGIAPQTAASDEALTPQDLQTLSAGLTVLVSCWD